VLFGKIVWSIRYFCKDETFDFKYTRQSIGIFLVFMGSPLIFFFKETLGFGGSSAFT
jgi:hypothetical protein